MIALVQRPRRKMHLASRTPDGAWLTVCDRDVAADARVTELDDALGTIDGHADQVCVHCHRLILMAAYVGRDRVAALVASLAVAA